ncbi:anoctamin-9 [Gracilinanus agilis]|uniref:anoctamin-9 n=1 Tax=Gracilinanus agilis TaxID=191870 RepID=UPI001CFEBC1E|nr:anoctamin-9 [Gracilinanus agilis]
MARRPSAIGGLPAGLHKEATRMLRPQKLRAFRSGGQPAAPTASAWNLPGGPRLPVQGRPPPSLQRPDLEAQRLGVRERPASFQAPASCSLQPLPGSAQRPPRVAGALLSGAEQDVQIVFESDSFPLVELGQHQAAEAWDFVLVSDLQKTNPNRDYRRKRFLDELKRSGFTIKEIEDRKKMFYGIRAHSRIFSQYGLLLKETSCAPPRALPRGPVYPVTDRIRIVYFVLRKKEVDGEKFEDLMRDHVFEAMFPLHEREEFLQNNWARWSGIFHKQPIDRIRDYFGEKVALYFAWLGWYTVMLVPAAGAGLLVFLSGFSLFDASQISKEVCEARDVIMCPLQDHQRKYWRLSEICTFAKLTHLFDNEGTVFIAIFMALWATVFLEFWKRERARTASSWNLYGWDEDQEELALELINNPAYQLQKHQHSYLHSSAILIFSLVMICLMIGMAHVLVVYRVMATFLFSHSALPSHPALPQVNRKVALKLCDFEKPRTFSERESNFTIKFFTFQFFAHFSSLFYVAFFLGRINGHPGNQVRIGGQWRLEECHPSGCMMDLFVQMAIIMGLKQTLSNCVEYLSPWLKHRFRRVRECPQARRLREPALEEWLHDYCLNEVNVFSLFDEFMEMMIQYGFTTIFVAAFPLAPLLALFSNLIEIRLDAIKMVRLQRRLVPRKAKDIGTWLQVLEAIGVLAVIANGMIIAFTSEFIPRLVYKYLYGPCSRAGNVTADCLTGYINHSLSVFHTTDYKDQVPSLGLENVTECRYRDYRDQVEYKLSAHFWFLLACRLAFVILFEHVALCGKLIAAWFVPDVPQSVKNKVLEEKFENLCEKLRLSSRVTDV